MKHGAVALLCILLCPGSTLAADPPATKPGATATKASKPSARGPGTQTEDDLYVGAKAKPATSAQTKTVAGKPKKAQTGDEDLDDLEIQRGKVKSK